MISIILAAGKSTRMRTPDRAKVCFPIAGKPAIVRALEAHAKAGATKHVIVVGHQAEEVMRTVHAGFSGEVHFAFQPAAGGTGDAAARGYDLAKYLTDTGPFLVVAGDLVVREAALQELAARFQAKKPDLAFLAAEKEVDPDAGRLVFSHDGALLASIEKPDSGRSRFLARLFAMTEREGTVECSRALALASELIGSPIRAAAALGPLMRTLESQPILDRKTLQDVVRPEDRLITIAPGRTVTGAEVEKARYVNMSVYLFARKAIEYALPRIRSSNAQKEKYLTDVIQILASSPYRTLEMMVAPDRRTVMAFNTREELSAIEAMYTRSPDPAPRTTPPRQAFVSSTDWIRVLEDGNVGAARFLQNIHGASTDRCRRKADDLRRAVVGFQARFGAGPLMVARAPEPMYFMGRLTGEHGGVVQIAGSDRDTVLLLRPRSDRSVCICHLNARVFPSDRFKLSVPAPKANPGEASQRPSWTSPIRHLYDLLQARYPMRALKGADILVANQDHDDAGCALTAAAALGLSAANGLDADPETLVGLCSEIPSRVYLGQAPPVASLAASLYAEPGVICELMLSPARIRAYRPFPPAAGLLELSRADETVGGSAGTKSGSRLRHRQICMAIALHFLRESLGNGREKVGLDRLLPESLGMTLEQYYHLLAALPSAAKSDELRMRLEGHELGLHLETDEEAGRIYPLRTVGIFGMAETARSRLLGRLLDAGDADRMGKLMALSHEGDRVSARREGRWQPFIRRYPKSRLLELARTSTSQGSAAKSALALQPGGIACSTMEVDRIVDALRRVDGVFGARLSGSGIGGTLLACVDGRRAGELHESVTARLRDDHESWRVRSTTLSRGACLVVPDEAIEEKIAT